jgi:hypothetical protein
MRHRQASTWTAFLGFAALHLLLVAVACGRVSWDVPPLESDEVVEPEPEPEPTPTIPWTDPFERYPYDVEYFADIIQPMLQADGCATCHIPNYAYPPRLHANPEPDSAEMWHNFEQAIGLIDLDVDAEYARLVYYPLVSDSHVTTAWHESRQGPEAYAPVVAWIEDAQATRDCYLNRYEDVVEHDGPAIWSTPCDPAPIASCWPHEACPDDEEENGEEVEENGEEEGEGGEEDDGT